MSFLVRWDLGAKALRVLQAARDLASHVDIDGVVNALLKVVEIERQLSEPGNGRQKAAMLLQWFASAYPQYASQIAIVQGFANAVVALANAAGLFRKS